MAKQKTNWQKYDEGFCAGRDRYCEFGEYTWKVGMSDDLDWNRGYKDGEVAAAEELYVVSLGKFSE